MELLLDMSLFMLASAIHKDLALRSENAEDNIRVGTLNWEQRTLQERREKLTNSSIANTHFDD